MSIRPRVVSPKLRTHFDEVWYSGSALQFVQEISFWFVSVKHNLYFT
jgi:hypothetical protein